LSKLHKKQERSLRLRYKRRLKKKVCGKEEKEKEITEIYEKTLE